MNDQEPKVLSLPMQRDYLDKDYCLKTARRIIADGLIDGMSELQIAREIRFHAAVYYFCEKTGLFPSLKAIADPIDLCDDGDSQARKAAFALGWFLSWKK